MLKHKPATFPTDTFSCWMGFRLVSPQDIKPRSNTQPAWYSAVQCLYHQRFYTTWWL